MEDTVEEITSSKTPSNEMTRGADGAGKAPFARIPRQPHIYADGDEYPIM